VAEKSQDGRPSSDGLDTAARVASELREQIMTGVLLPGIRLKDSWLAEHYGVSRNTLRDALRQLESDGLVTSKRNAGCTVRRLTEEDAHDIYNVRHILESAGIDLSVAADRGDMSRFNNYVELSSQAAAAKRWSDLGTGSLRLHQGIVELIGSPQINTFFSNILAQLRLVFAVMQDEAAFQIQWVERDAELVALLTCGNRRQAQLVLRQYLLDSEGQIIDAIRASDAAG
jgi:DNA-binding GntR family transcriptional regulator